MGGVSFCLLEIYAPGTWKSKFAPRWGRGPSCNYKIFPNFLNDRELSIRPPLQRKHNHLPHVAPTLQAGQGHFTEVPCSWGPKAPSRAMGLPWQPSPRRPAPLTDEACSHLGSPSPSAQRP